MLGRKLGKCGYLLQREADPQMPDARASIPPPPLPIVADAGQYLDPGPFQLSGRSK